MKKFSKESMQQFMLMHAEKLILGACLAATGLFVWMSLGGEQKNAQMPSGLKGEAEAANVYINKDAWAGPEGLEQFRKGKVEAEELIANTEAVDGSKFRLAFGGSPAQALALRKDPTIIAPEDLIAVRFSDVGVMVNYPDTKVVSPLMKFHDAPEKLEDEGEGSGTRGSGTKGDGSDRRPGAGDNALHEKYEPLERSSIVNPVNVLTGTGIRPELLGISDRSVTTVVDGVCVTAVVDIQKQSAAYENAFAESIAYNAKRDRPVYQFVQIQRRELSAKGGESEWKDISEEVTYSFAQYNPLKQMPFQLSGSAPEVISPDNFDPILTQAIPAFAQFDYRTLASHPKLKTLREFPAYKAPEKAREASGDGGIGFGQLGKKAGAKELENGDDINALRSGTNTKPYEEAIVNRKRGGQYRLLRFFDLTATKQKSFEYRVRVWVGDPNQLDPSDGFLKNRGMQLQAADGENEKNNKEESFRFAANGDGVNGLGGTSKQEDDDPDGTPEVVVDVRSTMLVPPARARKNAGTGFDAMQDRLAEEARRLAKGDEGDEGFEPFRVAEYSADGRNLEQIELPPSPGRYAYMQYLRYARPSAWSETVSVKSERPTADVMAGTTVRKRPVSLNVAGRTVEFDKDEPSFKVLVSSWSRFLGARLPAERDAYVGETMNFRAQAYVTHPITSQVKIPEDPNVEGVEKYKLPFRSNVTIVDAFLGSSQQLSTDKRLSMETPTEILTMDANGKFKVSNQFDAATDYRNELAMPDDSRFYGKPPKRRNSGEEEDGDELGDF